MAVRHKFDMTDSAKGHAPILAAGGIVLRGKYATALRRRADAPGKGLGAAEGQALPREHPRDAAKREVLEETGHDVSVHEFLGSMSYAAEGKIKIVQFWLMRATGAPVRELNDDVKAVKWLPLRQAIDTLTRPHEKVFLTHVGPIALGAVKKSRRLKSRRASGERQTAGPRQAAPPVEHVIAIDYEKTRPNAFVKALGNWVGRAGRQPAARPNS